MKGKLRYICLNIRNGGGLSQKMTQCLFMGIEGSLTMFIQREKLETSPCSAIGKRERLHIVFKGNGGKLSHVNSVYIKGVL